MESIPITRPWMDDAEVQAVARTIRSGWIMAGPRVETFERDFAGTVGSARACAVSSCTAGLHLALRAVGVGTGDVVVTVSHSFVATANSIRLCGGEPVFVDVDPATLNMDAAALAGCLEADFEARDGGLWYGETSRLAVGESPLARCTEPRGRLAAILVVHQLGLPADMPAVLAAAAGVPVVEDAACAVGSNISFDAGRTWEAVGRPHGAMACCSFHPRKVITTGEGGMVTTNRNDLHSLISVWRQHGMDLSTAERHTADDIVAERYVATANNYRMTDMQAAMGIEQLKRLDEIVTRRRRIARRYLEGMAGINHVRLPVEPPFARTNHQSFVIQLDEPQRVPAVMRSLGGDGIATRFGITCAHRESPYARAWPKGSLPVSERAQAASIVLPLYPTMTDDEIDRVIDALRQATL